MDLTDGYETRNIFITVRAYPEPSRSYVETSCVAGITVDQASAPIRIFPIPARDLGDDQKFSKYSIIRANVRKAQSDARPESHRIDVTSIQRIGQIDTKRRWADRNELVEPFRVATSLEELRHRWLASERRASATPSLALIRPREIERFRISRKPVDNWNAQQLASLGQRDMFDRPNRAPLEFIPYYFRYRFRCDDNGCQGHNFQVLDWEVGQSYRRWKQDYGDEWQDAMMKKYQDELMGKCDLQFFIGTLSQRPWQWTIIGLYYPRKL